jgi:hypothetical protein
MKVDQAKRLKQLKQENAQLKQLVGKLQLRLFPANLTPQEVKQRLHKAFNTNPIK